MKTFKEFIIEENKYVAMYNRRETTITANSSYEAHTKAVAFFKPPKSQAHMVHVHLAEKDGNEVVHSTAEI